MTYKEFTDRVKFEVSSEYYLEIVEPEYNESSLDKDEWCRQWKKNGGIQKAYNHLKDQYQTLSKDLYNEIDSKDNLIIDLKNNVQKISSDLESTKNDMQTAYDELSTIAAEKSQLLKLLLEIDTDENCKNFDLRSRLIRILGLKEYLNEKLSSAFVLSKEDRYDIKQLLKNE